jgi:lysophospholipase L1-like esterase
MTPNPMVYDGEEHWRNLLLAQYAQATRDVAKAEKVSLIDVWCLFEEFAKEPGNKISNLLLDFEHPNAHGHRIIADALMKTVVNMRDNSRSKQVDSIPVSGRLTTECKKP